MAVGRAGSTAERIGDFATDLSEIRAGGRARLVKDGPKLEQEIFDFLEQWLSVHILEVDASYAHDLAA